MKKFIAALFLSFIPFICFADTIKCYAGSKLIYSHHIGNFRYTGEIFIFEEESSGEVVMYNGNCVIKIDMGDE